MHLKKNQMNMLKYSLLSVTAIAIVVLLLILAKQFFFLTVNDDKYHEPSPWRVVARDKWLADIQNKEQKVKDKFDKIH